MAKLFKKQLSPHSLFTDSRTIRTLTEHTHTAMADGIGCDISLENYGKSPLYGSADICCT